MQRKAVVRGLGVVTLVALAVGAYAFRAISDRRFASDLSEAKQALLDGRSFEAFQRLSDLADRRPSSGELQYLLGLCESVRNHPDRADAAWDRIPPDDAHYTAMAALKRAELDREAGRYRDAEDRLLAALELATNLRPRIRWALVQIFALEGRSAEARRVYLDGLDEQADPVEALKTLYKLETEAFPAESARDLFAEAAALAPHDDRVWLGRAHLAIRSGDERLAEELLKDCLSRRPEDRAVWEMVLELGLQADRPDLVLQAMRRLPVDPRDGGRRAELKAWAARRIGDLDAERRALAEQPEGPLVLERLAEAAIAAGRLEEAAEIRSRGAEHERKLVAYLRRLGSPTSAEQPGELAELARAAGRDADAAFWSRKAGATTSTADREAGPASTLADALPDVVASLSASSDAGADETHGRPASRPRFEEKANEVGLRFLHDNGAGATDRLIPPLAFSGGVGLLDYDRDGMLDVYLVQSGRFPHGPDSTEAGDRLFRNRGDGTFEDVTEQAGLGDARGYGHGVAVGDVDGDGHPDLFVTRWRAYELYRNRGDGSFEDVTELWGLGGDRDWPTSAAFADLDGDGDLDLYVCHYFAWDENDDRTCVDPSDPGRYNCSPRDFPALPDHLFRNDGGRFVDATEEAGIVDPDGRGLGVTAVDVDGDGRVDLHVANDMSADYLFMNLGGLRFEERGLEAGVAANARGGYQAGMGVASGDVDGDGRVDLAVTNYYGESTSFFQNLGDGLFADRTAPSGLLVATRPMLGFGAAFFDADDDGRLDLVTANGHIHDGRPVYAWKMPIQLLQGGPPGRFRDVTSQAGTALPVPRISRGLAVGDLDGDGRLDVVVQPQNEPVLYLHNETEGGRSISFELEGTASHRDAIGAVVTVVTTDGRSHVAQRTGGGSYQSASSPILHVGLGDATGIEEVRVAWPSGRVDRHRGLVPDSGYRLREGDDVAVQRPRRNPPDGLTR